MNRVLSRVRPIKVVGQFTSFVPLPPDQVIFARNDAPGATVLPFISVDTVRVDDSAWQPLKSQFSICPAFAETEVTPRGIIVPTMAIIAAVMIPNLRILR